ncbi:MAG: YggT family protein [Clostridia bacterium]|nr:YggT family protein [Clostridia bacterium]MBR3875274.1 YggT family protein [Clostridia bacterium]
MQEFFYIIAKTVSIALEVVSFAMIIRMLLPIFIDPTESRIYAITCFVTEPFIAPVRAIMVRLNIGQDSPIDWAFSITYILIWLLSGLLPAI